VGTLAGIGSGLLILTNLPRIVRMLARCNVTVFPKEIYGLSEIPWETSAQDLIQICVLVMVACTASCIIPVLRAALLDPVEAFRQE
jgi:ABC-type lipoprotein release transport system permease subunit